MFLSLEEESAFGVSQLWVLSAFESALSLVCFALLTAFEVSLNALSGVLLVKESVDCFLNAGR